MKVIVIGATGSVGALTVQQLLKEGHAVTAFARRPETLKVDHTNLKLHPGDALKPDQVQAAIQGEQLRVTGKKRDDLQAVMALLREGDFGLPLQFKNFRD